MIVKRSDTHLIMKINYKKASADGKNGARLCALRKHACSCKIKPLYTLLLVTYLTWTILLQPYWKIIRKKNIWKLCEIIFLLISKDLQCLLIWIKEQKTRSLFSQTASNFQVPDYFVSRGVLSMRDNDFVEIIFL